MFNSLSTYGYFNKIFDNRLINLCFSNMICLLNLSSELPKVFKRLIAEYLSSLSYYKSFFSEFS